MIDLRTPQGWLIFACVVAVLAVVIMLANTPASRRR